MTAFFHFTSRNIKNYFRDISSVLFSFLSMAILIVLMLAFLGDMYSKDIAESILEYLPNLNADEIESDSSYFIILCTLGSVLLINSVSISMMVMAAMIRDEANKKLAVFYASPVKRWIIAVSYTLSAWLITLFLSICTLAFSEILLAVLGYPLLTALQILKLCALLALFSFGFSCISYLIASMFHSVNSWSAMLTIVGTLSGFLAGAYVPVSNFSPGIRSFLSALPFLQGAAVLRSVCTENILSTGFFGVPEAMKDEICQSIGNKCSFFEHSVSSAEQLLFFSVYTLAALALSVLITLRRRSKIL